MSEMGTTQARKVHLIRKMHNNPQNSGAETEFWAVPPWDTYDYFIPGNRPDPTEEDAASITWREMTTHQREVNDGE